MYFTSNIMDFANMFWGISVKILTEIMVHLKRSRQSIILVPRVPGVCGSVFMRPVSQASDWQASTTPTLIIFCRSGSDASHPTLNL